MFARLATATLAAVLGTFALGAAPANAGASWSMTTGPSGGICYRMPTTGSTTVTFRMDNVSLRNSSASYVTVLRHGRIVGSTSGGAEVGSHVVTRTLSTAQAGDVFRVRHVARSLLTGAVVRAIDYDVAAVRGTWCKSGVR